MQTIFDSINIIASVLMSILTVAYTTANKYAMNPKIFKEVSVVESILSIRYITHINYDIHILVSKLSGCWKDFWYTLHRELQLKIQINDDKFPREMHGVDCKTIKPHRVLDLRLVLRWIAKLDQPYSTKHIQQSLYNKTYV